MSQKNKILVIISLFVKFIPFNDSQLLDQSSLVKKLGMKVSVIDDMIFLNNQNEKSGQLKESYRWPKGIVPFLFGPGYTRNNMMEIHQAMRYIEAYTCIRFLHRKKEENFLYIENKKGKCQSFVGNIQSGPQHVGLDPSSRNCNHPNFAGHVLHELVHAIGFFHEHARDDRDNYIRIAYENLPQTDNTKKNFNKNGDNGLHSGFFGVPYNFDSIMHYSMRAGSINGRETILRINYPKDKFAPLDGEMGQRKRLSKGDIRMIQNMYSGICGRTGRTTTENDESDSDSYEDSSDTSEESDESDEESEEAEESPKDLQDWMNDQKDENPEFPIGQIQMPEMDENDNEVMNNP